MGLKVYNTLTHQKEPFEPSEPGRVRMYVCGVTVYDDVHLGHARGAVLFEVVRRYLRLLDYQVTYVRNFTDLDDKIIERAHQEGVEAEIIANRYIDEFSRDMKRLGLPAPDIEPKATEHIDEILTVIQALIEKGYAYASEGNVYFSVRSFPNYGALSRENLDDLRVGARVKVDERKRDPLDFALWKSAKSGEPAWESPWGLGRPGWHIECSAMSMGHLGPSFDIHGGGEDLIFPHHENERAQSQAYTGKAVVKYWMHNGFVKFNREKMSKSRGNILPLKVLLDRFHAETVRFFLLGAHYRSPLEYSEELMAETERALDRLYNCFLRLEEGLAQVGDEGPEDPELKEALLAFEAGFQEAMDNDFNTAGAIGEFFELAKEINTHIDRCREAKRPISRALLEQCRASLLKRGAVLGLLQSSPEDWFRGHEEEAHMSPTQIDDLVAGRQRAREQKDWTAADRIRDELVALHIQIEDGPHGTRWKFIRPSETTGTTEMKNGT